MRVDPATAARLYGKLTTWDKVDLVLGLYSSSISEGVADVNEKDRIVWPEELAPGSARFPTPLWSQRQ